MTDLEKLLREKQDELRGRPLNWRDHLIDRIKYTDWFFIIAMTGFCLWAAGYIFVKGVEFGISL